MTMPQTDFAQPRGSFPTPVKPPGVGPLVGPLVGVEFNYKWCSLIVGALSQLLLQSTWDVATPEQLSAIQGDVFDLMAAFCVNPPPAGVTPNTGTDGGDDFMLRQDPDNPCLLQTSVDGVNWCTWADLSKCLPAPAQPGPGSSQPQPGGGCVTYHAVLPANGKWLAPTFVNSGDTITISNLKGVWNGGTVNWYCPDGTPFVGFFCFGSGGPSSGDPDPTVNHMALIAGLSGGLFLPVLPGPVTIPGGITANTLEFQANDSVLSDNAGKIEFDVQICNNQASTWTHTFDFKQTDGGFVVANASSGYVSTWTPGVGWVQGDGHVGAQGVRGTVIHRDWTGPRELTQIQIFFTYVGSGLGTEHQELVTNVSVWFNLLGSATHPTSDSPVTTNKDETGDTFIEIDFVTDDQSFGTPLSGSCTISKVVVSGKGTDPF